MSRAARPRLRPPKAVIRRAAGHRPPPPRPIRIAPRSTAAAASAMAQDASLTVDESRFDEPGELGPLPAIRRRLAALAAAALVVAVVALAAGGTRVVLATFTDQAAVAATFSTGTWSQPTTWFLHNDPTPPTGSTPARSMLAMDEVPPTAGTLYNYDTNCDSRPGRQIQRSTGNVTESVTCRFATWRSAALAAARTLDGTATVSVWARKTGSGGTNPTLRAFLRVFDPATSTYTELGAANATVTANGNQAWVEHDLTWSLTGVTVPAGRVIEVKIVATGGNRNVEIAYDANNLASKLTLP